MEKIKLKQAAGYVILPGLFPRVKELFNGGSGMLAFIIANIFQAARLLPKNHPYLSPANMRKFGVRDVFAQAGNNLVFDRQHIDQILIFFTLMMGFVLFVLQFVMLGIGFLIHGARAMPAGSLFQTQDPTNDIAFELLDRVFGIPDIFNSCVAQMVACGNQPALNAFPTPFNTALQQLFQYYSLGVLVVGVIIFLYYMFVVVMETAQTGTPFGRRFSHIWVPIRLVVAIGLLIPVSYGLNSAQYIVLYAAKEGSGFASNGWALYNSTLDNGLGVDDASLYARPKTPDIWPMVKFMLLVNTCKVAYDFYGIHDIQPYMVKMPGVNEQVGMGTQYADALLFYNRDDVKIRFGKYDEQYTTEVGNVKPLCGEISIPTQAAIDDLTLIGPYMVQESYFALILYMFEEPDALDFANVIMKRQDDGFNCNITAGLGGINCNDPVPSEYIVALRSNRQIIIDALVWAAREAMIAINDMTVTPELLARGWGGAGIWYNKIAEVNGVFFSAVNFAPTPSLDPLPMKQIAESKKGNDQNINKNDIYSPDQSNENKVKIGSPQDEAVGNALNKALEALGDDDTFQTTDVVSKSNIIIDTINKLFGTSGLYTMRENTDIHPLAQLVGLGKGIMDATVRNLFTATIFSVGGGMLSAFTQSAGLGNLMVTLSGLLVTVTTISLTVGFVLYYVLPFLPFMYFFFAVGTWVKAIFEAMVGVPLWALGHLRIDGHGLPGESALDGYFMILEIFLRPILTVFGLIGGLITFTALAKVLNQIFNIVTDNLTGFDDNPCIPPGALCAPVPAPADMLAFKRGVIDEFFFTIIYTIIVYMMATGSFKMIDQIPARIMRWMGAGVQAFTEHNEAEDRVNKYLVGGAASMTNQLGQVLTQDGATAGYALGKAAGGDSAATPPTFATQSQRGVFGGGGTTGISGSKPSATPPATPTPPKKP